jgi:hypothetical protein
MVADEDSTGGAGHDLSHAWGYLAAADDVPFPSGYPASSGYSKA